MHVVTAETKTSQGKGRTSGVLAAAAVALGMGWHAADAQAAGISVSADWAHTKVEQLGQVSNITTDKIVGGTGVNRFESFEVSAGNIANLHFGNAAGTVTADRLLNFVNNRITVNGTVNAVRGAGIGGDLYFVSPNGMSVGSGGVINAGSLTVAVPTQDQYEIWVRGTASDTLIADMFNDGTFFEDLRSGEYPINPAGVITVAGSIRAGNNVALSAANIHIDSGAFIEAGTDSFADLVNITDEEGKVTVSAGLAEEALHFVKDSDSGDVLLLARAEGDLADFEGNVPGEGTIVVQKVSAEITAGQGSTIQADRNVTVQAWAGNGSYTLHRAQDASPFAESTGKQTADVSARVDLAGSVVAAEDISVEARTWNIVNHTFGFNLATIAEQVEAAWIPVTGTIEYVDMSSVASVNVAESAVLKAGNDLHLTADAVTDVDVGDSTGWRQLISAQAAQQIPIIAAAAADVESESSVTVAGTLAAGNSVEIRALGDFDVEVGTTATVQTTDQPQASFVYTDLDAASAVTIADSAKIQSTQTDGQIDSVVVASELRNSVQTSANTYVSADGHIGLAVNISSFDASSEVNLNSGLQARTIDVHASNVTDTLQYKAKTTVGDTGMLMKFQRMGTTVAFGVVALVAQRYGVAATGTTGDSTWQTGGTFGWYENRQQANVRIGLADNSVLVNAVDDIVISAESRIDDIHRSVVSKQLIDNKEGNLNKDKQGSVAVMIASSGDDERASVSSALEISGESVIASARGSVAISSLSLTKRNRLRYLREQLTSNLKDLIECFTAAHYDEAAAEFTEAYNKMIQAFELLESAEDPQQAMSAFAEAASDFITFIEASIGYVSEASDIASIALTLAFDALDLVNPASYSTDFVSAGGKTSASVNDVISVAGSIGVLSQSLDNRIDIGAGTRIEAATAVSIDAQSSNEAILTGGLLDNFLGVPLPDLEKGTSLGATVVYQALSTSNAITVGDGARIQSGGTLTLTADDAIKAAGNAAGAGFNSGSLSANGLSSVILTDADNRVTIGSSSVLQAEGNMQLAAVRDDNIWSLAGTLTVVKSASGGGSALGAGVAINLGSLSNALEISTASEQTTLLEAGGDIELLAQSDLMLNALGIAGDLALSSAPGSAAADSLDSVNQLNASLSAASGTESGAGLKTAGEGLEIEMQEITGIQEDVTEQAGNALSQNADEKAFDDDYKNLQTADKNESAPITSSESAKQNAQQAAGSSLAIAAAGSVAWNDVGLSNTIAAIGEGTLDVHADALSVQSLSDKWVGAFAGAAAGSIISSGSMAQVNVGIGGAAAVNHSTFVNSASLVGLDANVHKLTVQALSDGTTVAEGLGMAVAVGGQQGVGIDAGVSVNLLDNTIQAEVLGADVGADDGTVAFDLTAWSGELQVTGGTSAAVAQSGSLAGAVGAAVSVADIANTIAAELSESTISDAKTVSVRALASLTQVSTAVGAQVAAGSTSLAVNGAVATSVLSNQVTADVLNTTVQLAEGGSLLVAARDASTSEGGEARELKSLVENVEDLLERDELTNTDLVADIELTTDTDSDSTVDVTEDLLAGASMTQVSVAVSAAATTGGSGAGVGAGTVVNWIDNTFVASSNGLKVSGENGQFAEQASSGVTTVAVAAGAAGTAGNFSLAGSAAASTVHQQALVSAQEIQSNLSGNGHVELAAANQATTVSVAGNANATFNSAGAGIGAAVSVAQVSAVAGVEVTGIMQGGEQSDVRITADNAAETWNAAANATASTGAAALGASVAVSRNETESHVNIGSETTSTLLQLKAVSAQADDTSQLWTLAGAITGTVAPGASAAGAVAYAASSGSTLVDVVSIDEKSATNVFDAQASAGDRVSTMSLAASAAVDGLALAGAASANEIERDVHARLQGVGNMQTGKAADFGALNIGATSRADIDNLGIVLTGSGVAAFGAGVAVNQIRTDVAAELLQSWIATDTLVIEAEAVRDIETIGIGAAAAGTVAVYGSTAYNALDGDVLARMQGSEVTTQAAAISAQSDDIVGTYAGGLTGAGAAALGLSASVTERKGSTKALLEDSVLEDAGGEASVTYSTGVDKTAINDDVVNDFSIDASLSEERIESSTDGIAVAATSTSTYRTLAVNAAIAGTVEVAGSGNGVVHGGSTEARVSNSKVESTDGAVSVIAGDYMNADASLTAVGGSGVVAANMSANFVMTEHATSATVEENSELQAADIELSAQAFEGVSSLALGGSVSGVASADATASVSLLNSSVTTQLTDSTISAENYSQAADYLGRSSNLGAVANATVGYVSAAINAAVTTSRAKAVSLVERSTVAASGDVAVKALRTNEWLQYGGAASASLQGGAATGLVVVSDLAGEAYVGISESLIGVTGANADPSATSIDISAGNVDTLRVEEVSAAAGTFVAAGATVTVTQMHDAAAVSIADSRLAATGDVAVRASQDRTVTGHIVMGEGSLLAALGANVAATVIGTYTDDYDALFGSLVADAGSTSPADTVKTIEDEYGALTLSGLMSSAVGLEDIAQGTNTDEASSTLAVPDIEGTRVNLTGTRITGANATIQALEDKFGGKVDLTIGQATAGLAAVSGSVATLRRHSDALVSMQSGSLSAQNNLVITSEIGATTAIDVYQGTAGIAAGGAAYADSRSDGLIAVNVAGTQMSAAATQINALDGTQTLVSSHGIAVAGVAAGAMVVIINDAVDASVTLANAVIDGDAAISAERDPTLSSKAFAGYGGSLSGVGAQAEVEDSGEAAVVLTGVQAEGQKWSSQALSSPRINVQSTSEGAALGVAVGVVIGSAKVSGATSLTLDGGSLAYENVNLSSLAGCMDNELTLTGRIQGYGGAIIDVAVNTLTLENASRASLLLNKTDFSEATSLVVSAGGHASYDGQSDAIGAGELTAGSNFITVTHAQETRAELIGSGTLLHSVQAEVLNREEAKLLGEAAGGAVIEIGVDAVDVTHNDVSDAILEIGGSWKTKNDIDLAALTQAAVALTADNTKGALGALSGASGQVLWGSETGPAVSLINIADGTQLVTESGDVSLQASTQWSLGAAQEGDLLVASDVYGAATGSGIHFEHGYYRTNEIVFGQDSSVSAAGSLTAQASSEGKADIRVLARTAGATVGAGAKTNNTVVSDNTVLVESGAQLQSGSISDKTSLAAVSNDEILTEAVSRVEGAALSGAVSTTTVDYERFNRVQIAQGAKVLSAGELVLNAGASALGVQADLEMTNRAESFAYAFLSGIDADLDSSVAMHDTVLIAGHAEAATDASVTADSGFWTVSGESLTHYWGQINNQSNATVAVKGFGESQSGIEEVGEVTVADTGVLEAGTLTKADITLSGILNTEDSGVEIEGSQSSPTVKVEVGSGQSEEEVRASVSGPTVESESNIYWERYQELNELIADYGSAENEKESAALIAYKTERQSIEEMMLDNGWAVEEKDENGKVVNIRPVSSTKELVVSVSGVTVSGGNIRINAQSVTGTGSIKAHSAEGIGIVNNTNASLSVSDIRIEDKGGDIVLNDAQASETLLKNKGFAGTVVYGGNTEDPMIKIASLCNQTMTITYTDANDQSVVREISPSTSVLISGDIVNNAGGVSVSAQENVFSSADIHAAGSLEITAGGSIVQTYDSGLHELGGSASGNSAWADEIDAIQKADSSNDTVSVSSNDVVHRDNFSEWVAGGDIIISGDLINLNGYVQSGYASYEVTYNNGSFGDKITKIREAWQAEGSLTDINVKTDKYIIQKEEARTVSDGSLNYKLLVAVWYDPVHDRLVVDDIDAKGGNITITGKLANTTTSDAALKVSDGTVNVQIEAGELGVLTGEIQTGASGGVIQLTDLFYADAASETGARVTRYEGGVATQYDLDLNGQIKTETVQTLEDPSVFTPKEGLMYVWTEGTRETKHYEKEETFESSWWGLDDYDLDKFHESITGQVQPATDLTKGATIADGFERPEANGSDANFFAWKTTETEYDSGWTDTVTEWDTGLFGFYGHKTVHSTRDEGTRTVITYTAKADHAVKIGTISGDSSVVIHSNQGVSLGGNIVAQGGAVTITAGKGDIACEGGQYVLSAMNSVTLKAFAGNIGSQAAPIRLVGGTEKLEITATAGRGLDAAGSPNLENGNIYLDGTALGAQRAVSGEILADATLSAAFRGDLTAKSVSGEDISLVSTEGSVTVDALNQRAKKDGSQRLDISAAGDVSVVTAEGTNDLGIGLIEAAGDVTITVVGGSLYDAVNAQSDNGISYEERLQSWIASGVVDQNGDSLGSQQYAQDVKNEENRITAEYLRYAAYRDAEDSLTESQRSDYERLKALYADCADATAAVEKMRSNVDSQLAKIMSAQGNYGWTVEDLVYSVADVFINGQGSATPDAGQTNIRGQNITITTNAGSVGKISETVSGRLDGSGTDRVPLLQALSRADVGDVTLTTDGVLSVQIKDAVTVESSGVVSAFAQGDIYLEAASQTGFTIGQIVSKDGDVRLVAQKGISRVESNELNPNVTGDHVTLRGGEGDIGSSTNMLRVNANGWLASAAGGSIYLESLGSDGSLADLRIYSLSAGECASLSAENLYSYVAVDTPDGVVDFSEIGYLAADTLALSVTNDVGTADTALRVSSGTSVDFKDDLNNVYLSGIGLGTLSISNTNASGSVVLNADDALLVSNVSAKVISAWAENDLQVGSSLVGEQVKLAAGGMVTATEAAITAANGDLTVVGSGITADRATLESAGEASLTADKDLSLESARVDAKTVLAEADQINAQHLSVVREEEQTAESVKLVGKTVLDVENATIAGRRVELNSAQDVLANGAKITAGADGLQIEATNVSAQEAALTSAAAAVLTATNQLNLTDAQVQATALTGLAQQIEASGLKAEATDELSLVAESAGGQGGLNVECASLTGDLVELSSSGMVAARKAQVRAGMGGLALAGAQIFLDEATIDSQTSVAVRALEGDLSAQDLATSVGGELFLSAAGNVHLQGEAALETDSLVVESHGDVNLAKRSLNVGTISVTATGKLDLGGDAINIRTTGDLKLEAAALTGSVLAAGSMLTSNTGSVSIALDEGTLTLAEAVCISGETVTLKASKLTLKTAAVVQAQDVVLEATRAGIEQVGKVQGGIVAGHLTANAATKISLGFDSNRVHEATLQAADDIAFGASGEGTSIVVNAENNGVLAGDLRILHIGDGVKLGNTIEAAGSILIQAASVAGSALMATGDIVIHTTGLDGQDDSVSFTSDLSARRISLVTGQADIAVAGMIRSESWTDIYRLDTAVEGTVSFGGLESGYTATAYNGCGDIVIDTVMHGTDGVYAITGSQGTVYTADRVISDKGMQGVIANAPHISDKFEIGPVVDDAADLTVESMLHLDFSSDFREQAQSMLHSTSYDLGVETISPLDRFYFLHLRPDAAANKGDNDATVLESGLPGRITEPLVRDKREQEQESDLSWMWSAHD